MRCRRTSPSSVVLASALLLGSLAGCTAEPSDPAPGPEPLSIVESEIFASTRFHNFDIGTRAFTLRFPDSAGEMTVHGYVDFPDALVYGAVAEGEKPLGLVTASPQGLSIREADPPVDPPLPAPADGWLSQDLDPADSALAGALAVLLSLGADRPENPQLLRQSDAVSLGTDELDGMEVHVFVGPSPTEGDAQPVGDRARYWIADDGTLMRMELPRGAAAEQTTIELADAGGIDLGDEIAAD